MSHAAAGLPGLLALSIVWLAVLAAALVAAGLPVMIASSLDPGAAVAAAWLMGLVSLPFLAIWVGAGVASFLAATAGRMARDPLGVGGSLGLGMRRALPVLGAVVAVKVIGGLSLVPAAFAGATVARLARMPAVTELVGARPILWVIAVLGLAAGVMALYVIARVIFAPWVALLEERGPLQAIERSWQISRGQAWRALAYPVLAAALAYGALLAVQRWWPAGEAALGTAALDLADAAGAAWPLTATSPANPVVWATLLLILAAGLYVDAVIAGALGGLYLDGLRRAEGFGAPQSWEAAAPPTDLELVDGEDDDTGADDEPWAEPVIALPQAPEASVAWVAPDLSPAEADLLPGPAASPVVDVWDDGDGPLPPTAHGDAPPAPEDAEDAEAAPPLTARRRRLSWLSSWLPEPRAPRGADGDLEDA